MIGLIKRKSDSIKFILTEHGGNPGNLNVINGDLINSKAKPTKYLRETSYCNFKLLVPKVFL